MRYDAPKIALRALKSCPSRLFFVVSHHINHFKSFHPFWHAALCPHIQHSTQSIHDATGRLSRTKVTQKQNVVWGQAKRIKPFEISIFTTSQSSFLFPPLTPNAG